MLEAQGRIVEQHAVQEPHRRQWLLFHTQPAASGACSQSQTCGNRRSTCLPCYLTPTSRRLPPPQAVKGLIFDYATTCRADEELLTQELKARGINVRVHVFDRPLDSPFPRMAGPAAQYRK